MVTHPIRLILTFAAILFARGVAVAQLPEAPPPHPALAEVATAYQRLGLPEPLPDAELVRINWWRDGDREAAAPYFLAFRTTAHGHAGGSRYFLGWGPRWLSVRYIPPERVEPVTHTTRALDRVDQSYDDLLCLAVHCRHRGWDDLAHALYLRALEQMEHTPVRELREIKWAIWQQRLNERGSDRAEIFRQLRPLADVAPPDIGQLVTHPHLLRHLERTIAPRTSKPGTPEALIDDLVDYWHDNEDRTNESGREAYWKLVEMGFDAVPALLDHLGDERYTYALVEGIGGFICRPVLVGDLAGEIVYRLAGGRIEGVFVPATQRGVSLDPQQARAWWAAAKQVGEEKWLLDRVVLAGRPGDADLVLNENVLRVLGAKYPARLRELYQAAPRRWPGGGCGEFLGPILASRLAKAEKVALFTDRATAGDLRQREYALHGLAKLDGGVFRKYLLLNLREAAARAEKGELGLGDPAPIVPLVVRAGDRACWDALAAVSAKESYDLRIRALQAVGPHAPADRPDPARRERVRFLVRFLDDRTVGPGEGEAGDGMEVRDIATLQLMGMLGFPVRWDDEDRVELDPNRGPITRLVFREVIRRAAEEELARLKK